MAKKWAYVVHGPNHLRPYSDKAAALKAQAALARRTRCGYGVQVYVEKVLETSRGVYNQYAKGAKVISVIEKACKRQKSTRGKP